MQKYLRSILLWVLFLLVVLYGYGVFCDWFFRQVRFSATSNKRGWILRHENKIFDYAVLGSSRAEGAFDMRMLDSNLNIKGINIASNGSGYVENHLILKRFLIDNKNQIKYLFLQVDVYALDPVRNFSNAFHVYNFLPFWDDTVCRNTINHYLDKSDRILFTSFPWTRFYKYNRYFSPSEIYFRLKTRNDDIKRIDFKHNADSSFLKSQIIDSSKFFKETNSRHIRLQQFDVESLLRLLVLAKRYNIKVICFTAPDFYYQEKIFDNYNVTKSLLEKMVAEKQIDIIYPREDMRINIDNFTDPGHLSDLGRYNFTKYFSNEVQPFLRQ